MSSDTVILIDPNTDPYGYLGLAKNPDGSITRVNDDEFLPTCPASSNPDDPNTVLSKDIPISQKNGTWARVYLPGRTKTDVVLTGRMPLIVHYHGGGFIIGSASTLRFHNFCMELANEIQAVIVSVDYRLSPEHRLPAAYDDCMEALHWLSTTSDEWLTKYANLSKCFLMGHSAGGNIVYNVGLHAVTSVDVLEPLKIQGLILLQPFFGGIQRTPSEIRLVKDKVLPPSVTDILWDLALPMRADRDHEYSNPMVSLKLDLLEKVKGQRWKVVVNGFDGDPLVDRQIEFVEMLKGKGLDVIGEFSEGGFHGCELFDDCKAKVLYALLKKIVLSF